MDTLKSKIIYKLTESKGLYISGAELAKAFNVSRNAVWKIIKDFQNQGYAIDSKPNKGYRFIDDGDLLNPAIIKGNLKTKRLARRLEVLKSVDSTNIYLKKSGITTDGYTVVSDTQTSGQGRRGRVFYSPCGGIYLSTLVSLDIQHKDLQFITICAAVAVARAIKEICGFDASIKWVNDIYYNNKKLGGISTQVSVFAEILKLENVILGIGINTGKVSENVQDLAVSILEITGKKGFRNLLIAQVLNNLEEVLDDFKNNKKAEILNEYKKRLFILNKTVSVIEPTGNTFDALVRGLTENGELIVEDKNQKQIILNSSEISIKG